jgi:hypothetical protein
MSDGLIQKKASAEAEDSRSEKNEGDSSHAVQTEHRARLTGIIFFLHMKGASVQEL